MHDLPRREFLAGTVASVVSLAADSSVVSVEGAKRKKWLIGHHFWNWDRAWDKGEFLDRRFLVIQCYKEPPVDTISGIYNANKLCSPAPVEEGE